MQTEPTDRELVRVLGVEPAAFELFYRRHVDRVIGFAARRLRDPADVADAVATTFLTVLTAASSYDPDRGEPVAWMLGITTRLVAGRARRSRREMALAAKLAGRRLLDADDIERLEERIAAEQSAETVMEAIRRLKPRDREALMLVGVDGLTPTQAAGVIGISAANFRMRLTAARRALHIAGVQPDPSPGASRSFSFHEVSHGDPHPHHRTQS
jgi:RNA polymerase sigma factor (sigma-70 family)